MTRRDNLVAVGSDPEHAQASAAEEVADDTLLLDQPVEEEWQDEEPARRNVGWVVPTLAVLAVLGWTGFFGWANRVQILAGGTPQQWSGWIVAWSVPVLLVQSADVDAGVTVIELSGTDSMFQSEP